jgi:hypothetical protein
MKVVVSFDGGNVIADHLRLRFIQMWESKNLQSSEELSVSAPLSFYNVLRLTFSVKLSTKGLLHLKGLLRKNCIFYFQYRDFTHWKKFQYEVTYIFLYSCTLLRTSDKQNKPRLNNIKINDKNVLKLKSARFYNVNSVVQPNHGVKLARLAHKNELVA